MAHAILKVKIRNNYYCPTDHVSFVKGNEECMWGCPPSSVSENMLHRNCMSPWSEVCHISSDLFFFLTLKSQALL